MMQSCKVFKLTSCRLTQCVGIGTEKKNLMVIFCIYGVGSPFPLQLAQPNYQLPDIKTNKKTKNLKRKILASPVIRNNIFVYIYIYIYIYLCR